MRPTRINMTDRICWSPKDGRVVLDYEHPSPGSDLDGFINRATEQVAAALRNGITAHWTDDLHHRLYDGRTE